MIKNRAFIMIVFGAIFFYALISYFMSTDANSAQQQTSQVDSAPRVDTTPGSVTENERYRALQEQANDEKSQEAKKKMESFVPTLVNRAQQDEDDVLDRILAEKKREKELEEDSRQKALREAQELSQKRLREQQERMDKLRDEQEQRRRAAEQARLAEQKAKEHQAKVSNRKQIYLNAISQIDSNDRYTPSQQYTVGSASNGGIATAGNPTVQSGASVDNDLTNATSAPNTAPLYKAGSILYAVIETSLNTDEPAPILAKITSGPLAGSRLIGSSQGLGSQWSQAIVLQFNTISIPMMPRSQSIECIAVDPATARTALADEVNNHYIQRYGALFFSNILQGYSQAIQSSGATTKTDLDGNETTTNQETNEAEKFLIALGNVGTALSAQVATNINRPVTIKMNQGSPIGLLLLNDFSIQS